MISPTFSPSLLGLLIFILVLVSNASVSLDIDPTFGNNGRVTERFGSATIYAFAGEVAAQPSGRIIAVGNYFGMGGINGISGPATLYLTPNGTLDQTLGNGGTSIPSGAGGGSAQYKHAVVQPDGGFLILYGFYGFKSSTERASMYRLGPDGRVDFAFSANLSLDSGSNSPYLLAVSPDGKVFVLMSAAGGYHLLRLNSDGSRDASFGINGDRIVNLGRAGSAPSDMKVTDNGKIVFAFRDGAVIRLDSSGLPDRSFGLLGLVRLFSPEATPISLYGIVPYPDGRVLVAGSNSGNLLLARLTNRAKRDVTFGNGGFVIGTPGTFASDAHRLNNGQILVCGSASNSFLLSDYDDSGTLLATTFTSFSGASAASASSLAVGPDEKIVTLGSARLNSTGFNGFALTRHTLIQNSEKEQR